MEYDVNEIPVVAVVSGMAFEAAISQGPFIHTVYGLDTAKLLRDMEDAIKNGATGLLSFGTAAGLAPSLKAGSIVIAGEVRSLHENYMADGAWSSAIATQLPEAITANTLGVDQPIVSTYEKTRLCSMFETVAADMESHHVAEIATRHKLPFAVIRVVLDDAHCSLPPAALGSLRPDGTVSYGRLAGSLLAQPMQITSLLRLAARHAIAKKALLHCCRTLKGSRYGLMHLR